MKKAILFFSVFLITIYTTAQDSKFSTSLAYPVPVGDNFIKTFYKGVLDLGIQYRFVQAGPIKIGASTNITYLNHGFSEGDVDPGARRNVYFVQPRIFGELYLEDLKRFKPSIGLGYTYVSFVYKSGRQNIEIPKVDYNGYNLNLACTYEINDWFFALMQYEFIKISNDIGDNLRYNKNLGLMKFGIGARF